MYQPPVEFDLRSSASEIVTRDYRAALVFRKYGIEYCCGGRFPLEMVCDAQGLQADRLVDDLRAATRDLKLPSNPGWDEWSVDFLIDYIVNIHHRYLRSTVPAVSEQLRDFISEHEKKMPWLRELGERFARLEKDILPHLNDEEETVFPYIRQLAHAWQNRESYAVLLVKTLRKPVRKLMDQEQQRIQYHLSQLRDSTSQYQPPEKACVNHKVVYSQLRELDRDLALHLYLENDILFPRVLQMEEELLEHKPD
jgi:regulator of cell morphogenesis and NO signaling